MSSRSTALLVAVLAGLVGYLWLGEARPRQRAERASSEAPFLAVTAGSVARVELDESGGRLTAVRADGGWRDAAGARWRDGAVESLLDTLGTLGPVTVVARDPTDPTEYGLGTGAARLRVTTDDGRSALALELGARNPAWTGLYARRAGEHEVLLVGALLGWELEKLHSAAPGP